MELDQAWMGKGAVSGHLAAPAAAKDLLPKEHPANKETEFQGGAFSIPYFSVPCTI